MYVYCTRTLAHDSSLCETERLLNVFISAPMYRPDLVTSTDKPSQYDQSTTSPSSRLSVDKTTINKFLKISPLSSRSDSAEKIENKTENENEPRISKSCDSVSKDWPSSIMKHNKIGRGVVCAIKYSSSTCM